LLNFKSWILNEMPLGNYGWNYNKPPTKAGPPGADTPDNERGIFNSRDRVVISHPKTLETLEKVLSKHRWTFNILLYEANSKDDFFQKISDWMIQNQIPKEGRITFAKNGSSGDAMTPWMILHTMGHALLGYGLHREDAYNRIRDELRNLCKQLIAQEFPEDSREVTVIGKYLKFKSVTNINNNNVKAKLGTSIAEFIYELFAEFMWNGKIRLSEGSPELVRTFFSNL